RRRAGSLSCERERRALAREPFEVLEREVPDHEVNGAEEETHADFGPGVAGDRRVPQRVDSPGRREPPRDRSDPDGQERQRDKQAGGEPDRILEQVGGGGGGPVQGG